MPNQVHQDGIRTYSDISSKEVNANTHEAMCKFTAKDFYPSDAEKSVVSGILHRDETGACSIQIHVTLEMGHVMAPQGAEWAGILDDGIVWEDYTNHAGKIDPSKLIRKVFRKLADLLGSDPFNPE